MSERGLPKTSGAYWWREKDGDEWEQVEVKEVFAYKVNDVTEYTIEELGGQWAKAHNPDDGIEAWAVFVEGIIRCHSIASTNEAVKDQLPFFESMHNKKCTVEAVTIYRKDKK